MGSRSQAQRDAVTVEIGYALVTAAFVAGVLFCLAAAPVLLFDLHGPAARGTLITAAAVAGFGFLYRVARVLWRFDTAASGPSSPAERAESAAPGRSRRR
ncbi:hypothetical protein C6N75_04760 [Streptomyces solincola]|uniref:Uncharacterized protein n=1 Tax=Streptomyces solincola TaxID=2100817 RepID=A0A2S9Q0Y6_9ACTN|nr:DUF6332 family protein [Streptomyces solincola]PRH80340.1 hypothetical protein C6N75_04760 [Streptomyces solincola]